MSSHYLTKFSYRDVGDWKLNPSDLTVTTNTPSSSIVNMPKIAAFWQHSHTNNIFILSDWGIGGHYELHYVQKEQIQKIESWFKKVILRKKNSVKYSAGERKLEVERENPEQFIEKVYMCIQKHT